MSIDKEYVIGVIMTLVSLVALCKTHADDVVTFFIWSAIFSVGVGLVLYSYVRQKN